MNNPIRKSLNRQALAVGENLVVKDRGDSPRTAVGREFIMGEKTFELELKVKELTDELEKAGRGGAQAIELQAKIEELSLMLEEARKGRNLAPIGDFYKVEGRQRKLSEQEKDDLRANMKAVGRLIAPLTVEPREGGGWNIISGNNRYDFAVELGWTEIDYHVFSGEEGQGNSNAFYANLIQSPLQDYEKYLGFKKIMEESGIDQAGIALASGIHAVAISRIMSFDRLPEDAKKILDEKPSIVGATAALEFAKLVDQGRAEQVTQAIGKIAASGITQSEAVSLASAVEKKPAAKIAPQVFKIKSGKVNFAELRSVNKSIRIEFKDQQKADEFAVIFHELLKEYADKEKK